MTTTERILTDNDWESFVEDIAEGRIAIFDVFKVGQEQIFADKNYEDYVNFSRTTQMLMMDVRILRRLMSEIDVKMKDYREGKEHVQSFIDKVAARDGHRLFAKLGDYQGDLYGDSPPLLAPGTFDECLVQYQRLIAHVESLWDDACRHFHEARYPLAAFLAILAIEEVGKLGRLWFDLLAWDRPMSLPSADLGRLGRDHRKKHFMGVVSGALINARLDRILGEKAIKSLLQDVDSGKIESFRQSCLYIDMVDGKTVLPSDRVSMDDARFYVVLAGELWAEVLGHFPWDFEAMQAKVISFERSVGFDEDIIKAQ